MSKKFFESIDSVQSGVASGFPFPEDPWPFFKSRCQKPSSAPDSNVRSKIVLTK